MLQLTVDLEAGDALCPGRAFNAVHTLTEPRELPTRITEDGKLTLNYPLRLEVRQDRHYSGEPCVVLYFEQPDGSLVFVCETSARLFCHAGQLIRDHYPRMLDD